MKLIAFAFTALCTGANANVALVERFVSDYKAGVAFAEYPDYKSLYARSTDREMILTNLRSSAERITGHYDVSLNYDGEPRKYSGVLMLHLKNGEIVGEEHAQGAPSTVDMALAGQAADVATTAAALMSGLAEANPLVAGAVSSPVGAIAMVATKLGMVMLSGTMGLHDCIQARKSLGSLGWGAAAWNIGLLASGVGAAAVLAAAIVVGTWDNIEKDAAQRCVA